MLRGGAPVNVRGPFAELPVQAIGDEARALGVGYLGAVEPVAHEFVNGEMAGAARGFPQRLGDCPDGEFRMALQNIAIKL